MNRILTAALFILTLSAPALPAMAAPDTHSDKPKPDPISCREVRQKDMALLSPTTVCKRSSDWVRINAGPRLTIGPELGPYAGDGMPSGNLSQPH